jgi:GDP-L-fucose synthase
MLQRRAAHEKPASLHRQQIWQARAVTDRLRAERNQGPTRGRGEIRRMLFDLTDKLVWVAGQHGMVGGAMMRRLRREGCALLLDPGRTAVDFRRQSEVEEWMGWHRPKVVFLSAGRVGGLYANDAFPADFLYDNLLIEANVIHVAYRMGVEKLLFFGSSCIYPREAPQADSRGRVAERAVGADQRSYAVARLPASSLSGLSPPARCDFISAMPANLYGPGDNFHSETSHVPAALLRRFHEAKVARHPKSWSGAAARRAAGSSTSTISPTPASISCGTTPGSRT